MEIQSNGKYWWEGSQAEHFLHEYMAKVDTAKDSVDLYKSWQEYYNYFSREDFVRHVWQEKDHHKFLAQYGAQKKDKKKIKS